MADAASTPHDHIEFVFRYRDLVAPTLEEHRKLIAARGACWWGWWKRPTESARRDVWTALNTRIAAQGSVAIGLFNSGTNTDDAAVHRAVVTQVIPPNDADPNLALAVPAGDEGLIPPYYSISTFSRGWLRLSQIDTDPLPFFGRYAYAEPPPLRGIPKRYLDRLLNKLVTDADELRTMDTTIWHVRPGASNDRAEKFLAPAIAVTDAISTQPIAVEGDTILHLTDLHFATGANRTQHVWGYPDESEARPTLTDTLALLPGKESIGLVIVSGDFTFMSSAEEFDAAAKSLGALLGVLGLGPDHLVIVPGNHDIQWTRDKADVYQRGAEVDNATKEANEEYGRFFRRVLQQDPDEAFAMGRRFLFPSGVVVEICALNSSSLEQGKGYLAGMGRVRPQVFRRVSKVLKWDVPKSLALRMLVVHHHLTATEDVEDPSEYYTGFGMAIDAKTILREAARAGVQLVLHGHRHRTFVWRESVYALPEFAETKWALGNVAILGGGSAGSRDVESGRHFVNLLTVGSEALTLKMLRSTNLGDFAVMQTWRSALAFDDGRLHLGDWSQDQQR